ncbi:enoyl-CoA hydratase-related protein [Streptomyces sp. NPDC050560]|uniref:enoyl-CoA hydratase-related protein n=1 Tax=Streptomyces sp. NPDC050560 TaxID=3365630 RepID=UPI0037BAF7AE
MPVLERRDVPNGTGTSPVLVLDIGDGENRFHPDWLGSVGSLLDEVEKTEGPRALVLAARGKFFSNGLDLDWLFAHGDRTRDYLSEVQRLFARLLGLPMVTVAALQGHTFAAGAMLSLTCDVRVMRADRGFWCLPEADLGMPFSPGMAGLIRSRLAPATAHEAMVTGRRWGGTDALAAGIVDATAAEGAVLDAAVERAAAQCAKAGPNLAGIRAVMYADVIEALRNGDLPTG